MAVKMCLQCLCKMNSEDGQVYSVCILQSTTVCSQNINKQIVNIADENLTDYRFHYTKSNIEFVTEFPCLLEHPVVYQCISNFKIVV